MAAGAFLGTCFVAMSLSIVSGAIYDSPEPAKEGFAIKVTENAEGGAAAPAKAEVPPIAPLLAKADVEEGAKVFKKCEACHNAEKGGPNKIGPNLYGVVGRPIASHEGFSYSSALKEFSKGGKETWTYEHLNHFIHDPRGFIPGTAMTFPGVKKDQERADVIAYLHTLSDNPVPFPKPEEAGAAAAGGASGEAAKPAEGAAPAEGGKAEGAAPAEAGKTEGAAPAAGANQAAPADAGQAPSESQAPVESTPNSGASSPEQSGTTKPAAGDQGTSGATAPADGTAPVQSTPESGAATPEQGTTGGQGATPPAGESAPAEAPKQPAAQ